MTVQEQGQEDQEPQKRPTPKRITATQLQERGWTQKMIQELLGEPDARAPNRAYPEHAPLRLYNLERVEEAERTDAFFELLGASEARRDAREKNKPKRAAQTMAEVEAFEIQIPRLEPEPLITQAIESYNAWAEARGAHDAKIRPLSGETLVLRAVAHYLRFNTPGYSELSKKLKRRTGGQEAYYRLTERVYEAIVQVYQDEVLEEVCVRLNGRPFPKTENPSVIPANVSLPTPPSYPDDVDEYNAESVEILRELVRVPQGSGRHVMSDYEKLSQLLEGVEEPKRFIIYKRFKAAIRDGVLLAVPVEGVVQIPRKTSPLSVPEHLIASDAANWLQSVLTEMNKPKKGVRRISALESDILEGKVSFEELAEKYRASLQPKAKPKQVRKKTD